jgi:signal recognition particle subunit SRP54
MTGQDAVNAAAAFDEALDITGVMLTKLDGDARGGAALSVTAVTGKPVKFAGVGEKLDRSSPSIRTAWRPPSWALGDVLPSSRRRSRASTKKRPPRWRSGCAGQIHPEGLLRPADLPQGHGLLEDGGHDPGYGQGALKGASFDEKALSRTEAIILSMTRRTG